MVVKGFGDKKKKVLKLYNSDTSHQIGSHLFNFPMNSIQAWVRQKQKRGEKGRKRAENRIKMQEKWEENREQKEVKGERKLD